MKPTDIHPVIARHQLPTNLLHNLVTCAVIGLLLDRFGAPVYVMQVAAVLGVIWMAVTLAVIHYEDEVDLWDDEEDTERKHVPTPPTA